MTLPNAINNIIDRITHSTDLPCKRLFSFNNKKLKMNFSEPLSGIKTEFDYSVENSTILNRIILIDIHQFMLCNYINKLENGEEKERLKKSIIDDLRKALEQIVSIESKMDGTKSLNVTEMERYKKDLAPSAVNEYFAETNSDETIKDLINNYVHKPDIMNLSEKITILKRDYDNNLNEIDIAFLYRFYSEYSEIYDQINSLVTVSSNNKRIVRLFQFNIGSKIKEYERLLAKDNERAEVTLSDIKETIDDIFTKLFSLNLS